MRGLLALTAFLPLPHMAQAEVMLACTFDTIPQAVMTYPDDAATKPTMQVGSRPPAEMVVGQGTGHFESARIDGYTFQFVPANSTMEVQSGSETLRSEVGRCATIGGPISKSPLALDVGATVDQALQVTEPEPSALESKGNWLVTMDKSQLDDSQSVYLSLSSDEPIKGQFGTPGPAHLYLRCQENKTSVFLILNDMFLSDIQGFGDVDYRIDTKKAATARMQSSTDNKALGLWSGGTAIPFAQKLMEGEMVVFRATPYNESPVEFSFDLAGLKVAIEPLRAACQW